jgi:DNA-binding transcriptional LysR family regulator
VSDGTIDVGITYVPIPKPQVEFVEVTKIKMGIYGVKKFKTAALDKLPFVVPLQPLQGTPSKVVGLDGWPDHKYPRLIKYKVTMMESAMELCRLGLCVAYLPSFVVDLHNRNVVPDCQLIEHGSPVSQKERQQGVFLIHRKHSGETALSRQVAKCLRSLA